MCLVAAVVRLPAGHAPGIVGSIQGGASRGTGMVEKLGIGATFPKMTLNLVDGGTLDLPDGMDAKYRIFLFYRGHW
jgi:hypothetical protein